MRTHARPHRLLVQGLVVAIFVGVTVVGRSWSHAANPASTKAGGANTAVATAMTKTRHAATPQGAIASAASLMDGGSSTPAGTPLRSHAEERRKARLALNSSSTITNAPSDGVARLSIASLVATLQRGRTGQLLTVESGSLRWKNLSSVLSSTVSLSPSGTRNTGPGRKPTPPGFVGERHYGGGGGSVQTVSESTPARDFSRDPLDVNGQTTGTLAPSRGGTGIASFGSGDLLVGNGATSGLITLKTGTAGQVLTVNASGSLHWATTSGGGGSFGSGNVLTLGDTRYVRRSGSTMTGSLVIRSASGVNAVGLNVIGGISGASLTVSRNAAVSGSLVVRNNITTKSVFSGAGLVLNGNANISGNLSATGSITSNGNITTRGTLSGATLKIMAGSSYILGNLGIGKSSAIANGTKLEVVGTISGSALKIQGLISASGGIIVNGNALFRGNLSGSSLTASNLRSCSIIVSDASGNLSCGQVTFTQASADGRYLRLSGGTLTGTLIVRASISGSSLNISGTITNSGSIVTKGNITTKSVFSGAGLVLSGNANVSGNISATGSITGNGNITTRGTLSGQSIYITGTGARFSPTTATGQVEPLLSADLGHGTVLIGTGGILKGSTGSMTPNLYIPGRVPTAAVGSSTAGLNSPRRISVQGRYAYVVGDNSTLTILDVTNPDTPVKVSSTTSGLSTSYGVTVQGRYVYVASKGNNALVIFDVSNPASPVQVGSTTSGLNQPYAVTVQGRYAYVASFNNSSLVIFDVSNPASPVQVSSTTSGLSNPWGVSVQGRYAYVTSTSNNAFVIFDVSNPANPTKVGSTSSGLNSPYNVSVQGRYAYVTSNGNNALVIFDVSNPASPVKRGSTTSGLSSPSVISVQGRYAYVTNQNNNALVIFDVSNPSLPAKVGSTTSGLNLPIGISVQGRYAYVTSFNNSTLVIYDLGGAYIQSLEVGSLEAASLSVRTSATIFGELNVGGGGVFGRGIQAQGNSSFVNTSTGGNVLTLTSTYSGALRIAARGGVGTEHILFGTGTTFDVSLRRPTGNALQTNANFYAASLSGTALVIRGVMSGSSLNISGNITSSGSIVTTGNITTHGTLSGAGLVVNGQVNINNGGLGATGSIITKRNFSGAGLILNGAANIAGSISATGSITTNSSLTVRGSMSGRSLTVSGTGSQPLIANDLRHGTVMVGTGGTMKGGTGAMTPNLYIPGRLPSTYVGSGSLGTSAKLLAIQGRYVYMSRGSQDLRIVDVSNANAPTTISTTTVSGIFDHIDASPVAGHYAYVLMDASLKVFDIANPAAPIRLGSVADGLTATSAVVQGRYVYVVSQQKLQIFDVGNPSAPIAFPAATINGGNRAAIYVQGQYAYIVGESYGDALQIYNISNPENPQLVSSTAFENAAIPRGIKVQGRYIYVVENSLNQLKLYDASNPASVVLMSTTTTQSGPNDLSVQGRYAYVATNTAGTIQIFDISNASVPVSIGSITAGVGASTVLVQGRYAYVSNTTANSLTVYDLGGAYIQSLEAGSLEAASLSVRTNLMVYNNGDIGGGLTVARGIQAQGNSAFVNTSTGGNVLTLVSTYSGALRIAARGGVGTEHILFGTGTVFDVSLRRPTGMALQTNANFYAASLSGAALVIRGVMSGSSLIVSGNIASSGSIVTTGNITTHATLSGAGLVVNGNGNIAGSLSATGSITANGNITTRGTLSGRSLYITGTGAKFSGATATGQVEPLLAADLTHGSVMIGTGGILKGSTGSMTPNLYIPGRVPTAAVGSTTSGLSGPFNIFVQGRYAYVVSYSNSTLVIFDVSNSASPVQVGSTTSGLSGPDGVSVQGHYAYVVNELNNSLVIFDVSNPSSPVKVGSTTSGLSAAYDISVQGRYAYVDSYTNNTLVIFDVSNPASPVNVGSTTSGLSHPRGLSVQGRYAYVDSYTNNTLVIFDVSNPSSPVKVGSTTSGLGGPYFNSVQGHYAYVTSTSNNAFVIFDVSNPSSPVKVGSTTSGLSSDRNVSVQGRYAYVDSSGNSTFVIFDVSNPSSPVKVGSTTSGLNQPLGLSVQGRYAYVVNTSNNALVIFDLGGAYIQQLEVGGIEAGTLSVRTNATIVGDLNVGGGAVFGRGIQAQGPSALLSTSTGASTLTITSTYSGALRIAARGGVGTEHILFGTGTTFDVSLRRPTGNALQTNANFYAASLSGTALVIRGVMSGSSLNVSGNITNSGSIVTTGNITTHGTLSGAALTVMSGNSYVLGKLGIGKTGAPNTALEVEGTLSGRALVLNGNGNIAGNISATGSITGNGNITTRGTLSGQSIYITGTGSQPLIATNNQYGTIMIGTGGMKNGTGAMMPQLYVTGKTFPVQISSMSFPGGVDLRHSTVQGRYLYAVGPSKRIQVLDVSNPQYPVLVGSGATGTTPQGIVVQGRYAYVVNGGDNSLQILDLADQTHPTVVGSGSMLGVPANRNFRLAVQGRYAYIVYDWTGGNNFRIYDVSNPSSPVAMSAPISINQPKSIAIYGNYAYVGTYGSVFYVVNISNPQSPRIVGSVTAGGDRDSVMTVQGRYAYALAYVGNRMSVFDVANPAAPALVGSGTFRNSGNMSANAIQVQGRYVYASDPNFGLYVYDVANPRRVATVGTGSVLAYGLNVQGRYLYANMGGSVRVYDLGGAYIQQLEVGGLEAGTLSVRTSLQVVGDADIRGGLSVTRGLNVTGPSSFLNTATGGNVLTLVSTYSGALRIAARGGVGTEHILFGTGTTFDVSLRRPTGMALQTNANFYAASLSGTQLVVRGSMSGYSLNVSGNVTTSGSIVIHSPTTTASTNLFVITSNVTTPNTRVFRITATGGVYSNAPYNSAGADYAEWFKTTTPDLAAGQLVCVDPVNPNTVNRCGREADSNVIGIVSTRPSFIGNSIGGAGGLLPPGYTLIGLIGQVPAKVVASSGAIHVGDQLTASSTPGVARKANAGESTVGVALESLAAGQAGTINVLISRRNQSLTGEMVDQKVLDQIASMGITDQIKQKVADAIQNLNLDQRVQADVAADIQALDLTRRINHIIDQHVASGSLVSGSQFAVAISDIRTLIDRSKTSALSLSGVLLALQDRYGIQALSGATLIKHAVNVNGSLNVSSLLSSSGGLAIKGSVTFQDLVDCPVIGTDANGTLVCKSGLISQSQADQRYLQTAGGTLTGALVIQGTSSAAALRVQGLASVTSLTVTGTGSEPLLVTDTGRGTIAIGGSSRGSAALDVITGQADTRPAIQIDSAVRSGAQNMFKIVTDVNHASNTVFRITATGAVYTNSTYNSAGADYAEWFFSPDTDLAPGDLVCLDPTSNGSVVRCKNEADLNLMGIVSTHPAFIGNSLGGAAGALGIIPPGYKLIGLIGRVPAKVIVASDSGTLMPIRPGDALTASNIPGVARKARAGESTVGIALAGYNLPGIGSIEVLISRRNQSLTADAVSSRVLDTIKNLSIGAQVQQMVADSMQQATGSGLLVAAVQSQVEQLNITEQFRSVLDRLTAVEQQQKSSDSASGTTTLHGAAAAGDLHVGGQLTVSGSLLSNGDLIAQSLQSQNTLVVAKDARIGGDLYLEGALIASDLYVPNALRVDGTLDVHGNFHAAQLAVSSGATISGGLALTGDLHMSSGSLILGDGSVRIGSGAILVGSGSGAVRIDNSGILAQNLIVKSAVQVLGNITIAGLADFLGDVHVGGELVLSDKQAGYASVPRGGTDVTVPFSSAFTAVPMVTATPNGAVDSLWWVAGTTQTEFTLHLRAPASADVPFTWIALGALHPRATTGALVVAGSEPFPVDEHGVPISSSDIWNKCIRNQTPLDQGGKPYNCGRYVTVHTWTHPDLNITFEWDTNIDPPRLTLPAAYFAQMHVSSSSTASTASVESLSSSSVDSSSASSVLKAASSSGASAAVSSASSSIDASSASSVLKAASSSGASAVSSASSSVDSSSASSVLKGASASGATAAVSSSSEPASTQNVASSAPSASVAAPPDHNTAIAQIIEAIRSSSSVTAESSSAASQ